MLCIIIGPAPSAKSLDSLMFIFAKLPLRFDFRPKLVADVSCVVHHVYDLRRFLSLGP